MFQLPVRLHSVFNDYIEPDVLIAHDSPDKALAYSIYSVTFFVVKPKPFLRVGNVSNAWWSMSLR